MATTFHAGSEGSTCDAELVRNTLVPIMFYLARREHDGQATPPRPSAAGISAGKQEIECIIQDRWESRFDV